MLCWYLPCSGKTSWKCNIFTKFVWMNQNKKREKNCKEVEVSYTYVIRKNQNVQVAVYSMQGHALCSAMYRTLNFRNECVCLHEKTKNSQHALYTKGKKRKKSCFVEMNLLHGMFLLDFFRSFFQLFHAISSTQWIRISPMFAHAIENWCLCKDALSFSSTWLLLRIRQ